MKLLMLGGTGAIGKDIVSLLKNDSTYNITITSRSPKKSHDNVEYIICDAMNNEELYPILEKEMWDVIVDFMCYDSSFFKQRIDKLLNSTKQYIFFSSARVYANNDNPIVEESKRLIDEDDKEYLATDEYALAKGRSENLLHSKSENPWTIIRPYITCNVERLQLGVYEKEDWLYRALKGRTIVFDNQIANTITTMTSAHDLAIRIVKLFNNKAAYNQVFQIATSQNLLWNEILDVYCKAIKDVTNMEPKMLLVDTLEEKLVSNEWQVKKDRYYNRKFDSKKVNELTQIHQYKEIKECLYNYTVEFLKNPKFKNINWKLEAKKDKLCKEHAKLTEIYGIKNKVKYILCRYFGYNESK